jgi:hypothetical protein
MIRVSVEPPYRFEGRRRVKGQDVSLVVWGRAGERAAVSGLSAASR